MERVCREYVKDLQWIRSAVHCRSSLVVVSVVAQSAHLPASLREAALPEAVWSGSAAAPPAGCVMVEVVPLHVTESARAQSYYSSWQVQ